MRQKLFLPASPVMSFVRCELYPPRIFAYEPLLKNFIFNELRDTKLLYTKFIGYELFEYEFNVSDTNLTRFKP